MKDFERKVHGGVIGIAGPVTNNICSTHIIPHWPPTDGEKLKEAFNMEFFDVINDFVAAGQGVCLLKPNDFTKLNDAEAIENGARIVMGPGTGLGEAILYKSEFSPCYEVLATEGCTADFAC